MTVFVTDIRYGDEFVRLRGEILGHDFPASALVGVAGRCLLDGDEFLPGIMNLGVFTLDHRVRHRLPALASAR